MQLKQGSLLQEGEYKIEKVLGQSEYEITYLAKKRVTITGSIGKIETTIKVVIKELFVDRILIRNKNSSFVTVYNASDENIHNKLKYEFVNNAQSFLNLKHDHIIKVFDVFEENGTAYYVMEYVDGGTLNDKILNEGAIPEVEAIYYIRQIADALCYVHEHNMSHLGVRPTSIFIIDSKTCLLSDFGLINHTANDLIYGNDPEAPAFKVNKYTPFELCSRHVRGFYPASDIYSLGATLYEIVTGETPPYACEVYMDDLPMLPIKLTDNVKKTITAAMQTRRKDRPQSIIEFLNILEEK